MPKPSKRAWITPCTFPSLWEVNTKVVSLDGFCSEMVPRKIVEKIVENSWLDPMKFIKLRVVTFKCSNWDQLGPSGKPFYGLRSEDLMIKSDGWQCHGLSSKLSSCSKCDLWTISRTAEIPTFTADRWQKRSIEGGGRTPNHDHTSQERSEFLPPLKCRVFFFFFFPDELNIVEPNPQCFASPVRVT